MVVKISTDSQPTKIVKIGVVLSNGDGSGVAGKSAYQIWLDLGNVGTEQDFLNSLKSAATVDLSGYALNSTLDAETAARQIADTNLQQQLNNLTPSGGGGIEVANTYAEINTADTAPRMVIVLADEQNNQGGKSIYAFDGTALTQLLTL